MDELLAELVPRVYRFALRLTNDEHQAEDLTQETLLKALKKKEHLREPAAMRVWLFRIAANLWNDRLRQQRRRPSTNGQQLTLTDKRQPSPDSSMSQRDDLHRALDELNALPDRQRQVLYLSAVEGLSLTEIADVLGLQNGAVRTNLSHARKRMRERLPDLADDL